MEDLGLLPGDASIAPAVNSQQEHAVARGGEQFLVVWSDYRGRSSGAQTVQGDGDILGVRLDGDGAPVDAFPFVIAGGMGLQQRPFVAWNGENWLVLFQSQDPVGEYFENRMRAVRVSPEGRVLDTVPLAFPPSQFTPDTVGMNVAGQSGQWLVTRCIYHDDGFGTYLAGQRIAGNGTLIDPAPLMLIDWVYGATQTIPCNGEYLVVGPDWNNSATTKARRIGLNGQPVAPSFNIPGAVVASNGSEYYVTWVADFTNLVGSRMTSTGTLLTPSGTVIVENFTQHHHHTLTHDGLNWWLEWGAADRLRTVRISPAGAVLDPGGGVLLPINIGGNINNAYSPMLAGRAGGGVHVLWYDSRVALGYDANVFSLPVSAANNPGVERCVSTGTRSQRNPELSPGPGVASAIAFISEAANDGRVLVHFLDANGRAVRAEPVEVHRAPTLGRAGIAWNGSVYLVAWDEGASGSSPTMIRARRMHPDGSLADAQPFDVMPGFNAAVGALGPDFLVAGTRFSANPQFIYLHGNRIDGSSGVVRDGPLGLLLGGGYVNGAPRVRNDGSQWFVTVHSMWTHNSSQGDAIMARVPPTGPPIQAVNPTPFSGGSGDLDIAFSGSNYLLVWRMNSLSNANNYIAGRIMNADGSFPPGYFVIAEAPGRQLRPTVSWDGSTYIVAWDDQRNQGAFFDARTDIYATRVSIGGQVLDPAGLPVTVRPDGDAAAGILSRGGATFIASARFTTDAGADSYRIGLTRLGNACAADFNRDGQVDFFDYLDFVQAFSNEDPFADFNGDGQVDFFDYLDFVASFALGC